MEVNDAMDEKNNASDHERESSPRRKDQRTKAKRRKSVPASKSKRKSIKRKPIVEQTKETAVPSATDEKELVEPLAQVKVSESDKTPKEIKRVNPELQSKLNEFNRSNLDGTLDLSSMNLIDEDIHLIVQHIFRNEKKKCLRLVLRDNALTSAGVKLLVDQFLLSPNNLKNLGLSGNVRIGDAGIDHLARLFLQNQSITLLALHNTGLTDRGMTKLAQILCPTNAESIYPLEKLYISFNKSITDQSMEAIEKILRENSKLKVLALQSCSLTDNGRQRLRQLVNKIKNKKFNLSE